MASSSSSSPSPAIETRAQGFTRILVLRGGALGDFILTLPALRLLREGFPQSRLEILAHTGIAALALRRFYADATHSIEDGQLARFFVRDAELPEGLAGFFRGFDLIVSYLHDPDSVLAANFERCGVARFIAGPVKVGLRQHATYELARPLEQLGLRLTDPAPRLFPDASDLAAAERFLAGHAKRTIALHPGSGSMRKNWPLERWENLVRELSDTRLVVIAGEAEEKNADALRSALSDLNVLWMVREPLPVVAAVLTQCDLFLGHDSGISHLAGAAGARCLLLFGPTEPSLWAPLNPKVTVLRAPEKTMSALALDKVRRALRYELMRIGIKT